MAYGIICVKFTQKVCLLGKKFFSLRRTYTTKLFVLMRHPLYLLAGSCQLR